jgi:hypothetical protein
VCVHALCTCAQTVVLVEFDELEEVVSDESVEEEEEVGLDALLDEFPGNK